MENMLFGTYKKGDLGVLRHAPGVRDVLQVRKLLSRPEDVYQNIGPGSMGSYILILYCVVLLSLLGLDPPS